jgi:hypothetical protein
MILFPGLLTIAILTAPPKSTRWSGAASNGTRTEKISFLVSPDGRKLTELTFDGYWRCAGKVKRQVVGSDKSFPIVNGKAGGVVLDPPTGDTWRFELEGDFSSTDAAADTFRMRINSPGCDAYQVQWAAAPQR